MNLALWSAKTGLDAQNTQMAIIANNLANANTTGYKSQRAAFQDLMYQNVRQVGAQSTQNTQYSTGLTLGTGVRIVATEANYSQGSSTTTSNPLDLQISGRGFFQITLPDGSLAYTRDGSFTLDNQGNVVTASGYPIQPAITIPVGTQSVTVGNDGAVTAVSASGKTTQIGQVQLADFINEQGLQNIGNNLVIESAASGSPQTGTAGANGLGTIQQGSLETSNVNTVTELVNMIECQRAYEMNSKAITTTDQMLGISHDQPVMRTPRIRVSAAAASILSRSGSPAARCCRLTITSRNPPRRAHCRRPCRAPTAPSIRPGRRWRCSRT